MAVPPRGKPKISRWGKISAHVGDGCSRIPGEGCKFNKACLQAADIVQIGTGFAWIPPQTGPIHQTTKSVTFVSRNRGNPVSLIGRTGPPESRAKPSPTRATKRLGLFPCLVRFFLLPGRFVGDGLRFEVL